MPVSMQFILAGHATITIELPPEIATRYAPHYTYLVPRVKATDEWPESYFVNLLVGSDTESNFVYLGVRIRSPNKGASPNKVPRRGNRSGPAKAVAWPLLRPSLSAPGHNRDGAAVPSLY